jgi:uncharacterized protein YerC
MLQIKILQQVEMASPTKRSSPMTLAAELFDFVLTLKQINPAYRFLRRVCATSFVVPLLDTISLHVSA